MSWAQASLSQTLQSQVLDVFLGDYAEDAMRVEVSSVRHWSLALYKAALTVLCSSIRSILARCVLLAASAHVS